MPNVARPTIPPMNFNPTVPRQPLVFQPRVPHPNQVQMPFQPNPVQLPFQPILQQRLQQGLLQNQRTQQSLQQQQLMQFVLLQQQQIRLRLEGMRPPSAQPAPAQKKIVEPPLQLVVTQAWLELNEVKRQLKQQQTDAGKQQVADNLQLQMSLKTEPELRQALGDSNPLVSFTATHELKQRSQNSVAPAN